MCDESRTTIEDELRKGLAQKLQDMADSYPPEDDFAAACSHIADMIEGREI